MRWVFCILMVFGMASPALAADYDLPILRGSRPPAPVMTVGPATFTRWSGFYIGGWSATAARTPTSPMPRRRSSQSVSQSDAEDQARPPVIAVLGKGCCQRFRRRRFSRLQYTMARPDHRRRGDLYAHQLEHHGVNDLRAVAPPQLRSPVGSLTR